MRKWHSITAVYADEEKTSKIVEETKKFLSKKSEVKIISDGVFQIIKLWCTKNEWIYIRDFITDAYRGWFI